LQEGGQSVLPERGESWKKKDEGDLLHFRNRDGWKGGVKLKWNMVVLLIRAEKHPYPFTLA